MGKEGLLITFEGTEGAGKSTLLRNLAECLSPELPASRRVILTREPGGSPIAESIRKLILERAMDPRAELFLYEASRAEHMAEVIRPALQRGDVVLCDRFTDSSLAYQSHARGLPWSEVKTLNRIATGGRKPDLTVMLDIDPELGLKRAREITRFEAEGVEFQRKVRQGFLKARGEDRKRWLVIKVEAISPEALADRVHAEIRKRFRKFFEKKGN